MQKNKQNVYSKLFSNTIIFAIGSFSSKLLGFLMIGLYTRALTTAQFGTVDLIMQIENLMLPIVTLSISQAVIRFGLDKAYKNKNVFTTAAIITIGGITVFTVFMPLLVKISYVHGFENLFYIYMITASVKLVFSEFVRSRGLVKLYAFNGLLTTVTMIILNIIFLVNLELGIAGYIAAIILSDLTSSVFLFFVASIYKYFSFKYFDKNVAKSMLKYSIPLIPATIMWWITSVSDRFLVKHYLGADANGIYTAAYKIPTIITTIYAMFNQAWNMSVITENENKGKSKFYKNVFNANTSFLYVIAAGILLIMIPLIKVLIGPDFYDAYLYSPILVVSTVFACMCQFLGGVYVASKKTVHTLITSMLAGGSNILLNILLIPRIGINGASIATLVSYMIVFVVRLIDTQKICKFKFLPGKIIINIVFLCGMMLSVIYIKKYVFIPLILLFTIIVLLNYIPLKKAAQKILPQKIVSRIPFLR